MQKLHQAEWDTILLTRVHKKENCSPPDEAGAARLRVCLVYVTVLEVVVAGNDTITCLDSI